MDRTKKDNLRLGKLYEKPRLFPKIKDGRRTTYDREHEVFTSVRNSGTQYSTTDYDDDDDDDDDDLDNSQPSMSMRDEASVVKNFLRQIKYNVVDKIIKPGKEKISIFISYAWKPDSDPVAQKKQHEQIERLAHILTSLGIIVIYDKVDLGRDGFKKWMADRINGADYIILLGIPELRNKITQSPDGNVAFEYKHILKKLNTSPAALIPILFEGTRQTSFPDNLPSLMRDCSDEEKFYKGLFDLNPVGVIPALFELLPSTIKINPSVANFRLEYMHHLDNFNRVLRQIKNPITSSGNLSKPPVIPKWQSMASPPLQNNGSQSNNNGVNNNANNNTAQASLVSITGKKRPFERRKSL